MVKRFITGFAVVALSLGMLQPAAALNILTLPVFERSATIDGKISPEEIANIAGTTMTLQGSLDKPKLSTTFYTYATPKYIYAAFDCQEPQPDKLVTNARRENGAVFMDDSVQFFICPSQEANRTNYYHFSVNAAGQRYSLNMANDQPVNGWQSAVQRTAKGWSAEITIPLTMIKASADSQFWRANAARFRPAKGSEAEETSVWVDTGTTLHNFRRFGYLRLLPVPFPELAGDMSLLSGPPRRGTGSNAATSAPRTAASATADKGTSAGVGVAPKPAAARTTSPAAAQTTASR
jgi:hypothetical protein